MLFYFLYLNLLVMIFLQPSNVFLSADNESGEITLKIGDFGLARTVKSSSGILVSHRRSSFQDYIGIYRYISELSHSFSFC